METVDAPELVPENVVGNTKLGTDEVNVKPTETEDVTTQQVSSAPPESDEVHELWPEYCNPSYVMPDIIDVKVTIGSESYFFPVSVVKATAPKLFLGGYRNKMSGRVYHHANSQTPSDQKKVVKDYSNLRTRETQTCETRTLSIQPARESGTQMERIDLKIDNKRDKVKYPKPYFTSDELMIKQKAATIELQRCWRGFLARTRAEQIRQRNIDFAKKQNEDREREIALVREQRVKDQARRTHPTTNADFAVLYNELEAWRKAEMAKIKAHIPDLEQRKQAMSELLINETKALQEIQKLKMSARSELQTEKTQQMLQQMAKPHQWQLSHGEIAQVHTEETQRAKELLDLFNALVAPMQVPSVSALQETIEQRLDVLLKVKWTVKEFNSALTKEIMELVDREADLLGRGRSIKSLDSLRLRISHLFLRLLENKDFNPRFADFLVEKQPDYSSST